LTILTEQLRDGRISLPEWAIRFRQEIKAGHSLTYTLARGGRAQMSAADWGRVGRLTRFHLGALDRYTSQLANGGLINFGRVRMYAAAIRNTFENAGRSIRLLDEQMPWARWIRTADESCPGCLAQASMPPRRLEDIPPIGSQECAANCRCYLEITPNLLGL
jgi:hypothetical protein